MNVMIAAKHLDISEGMKEYATERGEKLHRYFDRITSINVILNRDGNLFSAEFICHGAKGQTLTSKVTHEDVFAAMDLVTDKMERQITKAKEKVRGHHVKHPVKNAQGVELPSTDQETLGEDWL